MKNGTSQSRHRQSSILVCAVLALFCIASPAIAEDHSGSTGTATWTLASSPHIIIGDVTVGNGNTLTIEPGCEIKFDDDYRLYVQGTLLAVGTTGDHIVFTSNQPSPNPGDWQNIYFYGADPGTLLDYCDISYGGSSYGNVRVNLSGTTVAITNCIIEQSDSAGVFIDSSAPTISGCTIRDNDYAGIQCNSTGADPVISDCTIQNNGDYAIRTFGGNVTDITGTLTVTGNTYDAIWVGADGSTSGTWVDLEVPLVIGGELDVPNGDTLTLSPGCEIKFNGNDRFHVSGTLIADGEPADHIVFTSNQPSPSPGNWKSIYFYGADAGTLLDYCDISYGGSVTGNIHVSVSGTNVTITNCVIERSGDVGIYCASSSQDPQISDCTIRDNQGYAIRTYGRNVESITGAMSITGNTYNAILVESDGSTTGTWLDHEVPYAIGGELAVPNAGTLTLSPGCTLKFNGNHRLYVQGTLIADGGPADHIVFTSNQPSPSPGDWQNIYFYGADAGTLLDYCDISYGGSSYGNVRVNLSGTTVAITNCIIEQSDSAGVFIDSSAPTISGCTIQDNDYAGIQCISTSADPVVSDCTIQNNGDYAIRTFGGNVKDITGTLTVTGNTYDAIWVGADGSTSGTWVDHEVPLVIGGELDVPNGDTLTIEPGCTLKFNGNHRLYVQGTLIADGGPADHIVFTSNQPSPSPGNWKSIYFYGADAGTLLDYCDISYGGSVTGNIHVSVSGTNVTITNCVIERSGDVGIYCASSSQDPQISDCTIRDNRGYAIRTYGRNVGSITGAMSITGNTYNAILVESDGSTTGTWLDHEVPYAIGGALTVPNGGLLTLSPGCTLKFNGDHRLYVQGTLIADGGPADHIVFTSNQPSPSPGDWQNIYFYGADAGTLLDYCDISYGGSSYGNVRVNLSGTTVAITNCIIEQSDSAGVFIDSGSAPSIAGCAITGNAGPGVYCGSSSANPIIDSCLLEGNLYGYQGNNASPQFTYNNQIINNTSYGFYITGSGAPVFGSSLAQWNDIYGNGTYEFYNGTSDVYAYYVYWGDTDPSVIASRIFDDNDNTALGIVHFTHWLNVAHDTEYSLTPPVINTITATADSVHITWSAIPGAVSYKMYSSDKAYSGFQQDLTGIFDGPTWAAEIIDLMKFFHVTAAAEPEESESSNTVGFESYQTGGAGPTSDAAQGDAGEMNKPEE